MKCGFQWILVVGIVMPIWARACSMVGLEHEISFAAGGVELSATEVSSLTHWYLDKKESSSVDELSVFATRMGNDPRSANRARARLARVDALLRSLDRSDSLVVSAHIEKSIVGTNTIVVVAQPVCAKTGSCCQAQKIQ